MMVLRCQLKKMGCAEKDLHISGENRERNCENGKTSCAQWD